MRSRLFFIIALLTLLLMSATAPTAALSGGGVVSFTFDCDSVTVTHLAIFLDRDNTGIGNEAFTLTISDGGGNVLSSSAESGTLGEAITASTDDFDYTMAPLSNPIHVLLFSNAGNGFTQQVIWDLTGNSPCLPIPTAPATGFQGAGIPTGFVMHYIACTTPVFTEPAGVPVGEDRVLAGQTWFVDPTPVEGADGQQWTEIFVGSFINPWIPTDCLGGIAPLTPAY